MAETQRTRTHNLLKLLGHLEAEVMSFIWEHESAVVSELVEIVNRRRTQHLAYKTLLTICARLTKKGLLEVHKEGRVFRYRPTMSESEFVYQQAARAASVLLDHFGHAALPAFVDQISTNPSHVAELQRLLNSRYET
jgi:predicted transcriptional regulator